MPDGVAVTGAADVPAIGAAGDSVKDDLPTATGAAAPVAADALKLALPGVSEAGAVGSVTEIVPPPPAPAGIVVPSPQLRTHPPAPVPVPLPLMSPDEGMQFVWSARTPPQTGIVTVVDPVESDPSVDVVPPAVPQLVLLARTPAQTGVEIVVEPVTVVAPGPFGAAAPPADRQPVLLATMPAHTGTETAIGPVTPVEP
jgi:hypothetical protein